MIFSKEGDRSNTYRCSTGVRSSNKLTITYNEDGKNEEIKFEILNLTNTELKVKDINIDGDFGTITVFTRS